MSDAGPFFGCQVDGAIIDALASSLAESLRRHAAESRGAQGSEDLLAWGRRLLSDHFRQPPSTMHRWLSERLQKLRAARGTRINVIGPRGSAKSTLVTLAYVLRSALDGDDPYIWIVSDTADQAIAHLRNLRAELESNAMLRTAYPELASGGARCRAAALALPGGALIEAFGAGQHMRGRRHGSQRPTLIVCDDLQNDSHIQSRAQRETIDRWFDGALLKAGTARTNVVNLATALHRDAIALRLARTPGWTSRTFPAVARWPERMDLWQVWERIYADIENPRAAEEAQAFYESQLAEMLRGADVLWPEVEDFLTLMRMRVAEGRTAFEREKQGSPIDPALYEWPEEYFGEHLWYDAWPSDIQLVTLALDPSKGADARRGDYSALVAIAVSTSGLLYVEADLARRPTPQMVADGVALCRRLRPAAFGVESNQYQELLAAEFAAEFARQGGLSVQPWTIDNRVNKQVRIRRLGPFLSNRLLRFRRNSAAAALLVEQLREFPVADHDDGPDALEMAIRLAESLLSGSGDELGGHLLTQS